MTSDSSRVVLRLRTLVPNGISSVQSDVIDQLQELEQEGIVADLDIDVWGSSMGINISRDRDPTGTRKLLSEFERWADEHGCTLRPAFGCSNANSTADGDTEQGEYTRLPLLCLAIYSDTTIKAIYPHMTSEGVRTIYDGLDAVESMRPEVDQVEIGSNERSTASL